MLSEYDFLWGPVYDGSVGAEARLAVIDANEGKLKGLMSLAPGLF
jgi:hypothetical protein